MTINNMMKQWLLKKHTAYPSKVQCFIKSGQDFLGWLTRAEIALDQALECRVLAYREENAADECRPDITTVIHGQKANVYWQDSLRRAGEALELLAKGLAIYHKPSLVSDKGLSKTLTKRGHDLYHLYKDILGMDVDIHKNMLNNLTYINECRGYPIPRHPQQLKSRLGTGLITCYLDQAKDLFYEWAKPLFEERQKQNTEICRRIANLVERE